MRRARRKGGNKEKVFGCDLMEHLSATGQEVPLVLRSCSEFVESHGIVDGIYRLSGVSSNITKLRSGFESDGSPDLNKDTYLQDIHCVSSLCKAYFRELPNPLLTYQLYDKFAEAVAIQLEEERLVKIRDVLRELPAPHYRTLEFLMQHLVRVASFSAETNMHSRNLAIVWAPNLLRSKEIEVCGFNGTAAFMEVRVQSIVVEFILTHVPQLFPQLGLSTERRKSLPSPSLLSNQEEAFSAFKSIPKIGNLSPGDGPLSYRPYHAIIEGTDKRKGSLKGRKWMSIFNIGGRFQETRRRNKNSTKEKEHPALRSARSMDSLSSPISTETDSKCSLRPPSSLLSPPDPLTGSAPASSCPAPSPLGGSEYSVTYRRGTGPVASSDPEDPAPTRSPGVASRAERRAAVHITGPTLVSVPLHITSTLALKVLHGGGADRIVRRGRGQGKEAGRAEEGAGKRRSEAEEREGVEKEVEVEEEEKERGQCEWEVEMESAIKSQEANCGGQEENGREDTDLQEMTEAHCEPEETESVEISPFDPKDMTFDSEDDSTEVDPLTLSGYIQDNFDFLDQMDCSIMDCSVSQQNTEFSVEPPGHYDEEYEVMERPQLSPRSPYVTAPPISNLSPPISPLAPPTSPLAPPTGLSPPRPLSVDPHKRHTKSWSLPYMTSPVPCPSDSEDDVLSEDGHSSSSSEEEEEEEEEEDESISEPEDDAVPEDPPKDEPMDQQDDHIPLQATVEKNPKEDILPDGPEDGAVTEDSPKDEPMDQQEILLQATVEADLKDILPDGAEDGPLTEDLPIDKPMDQQDHLLKATVEADPKDILVYSAEDDAIEEDSPIDESMDQQDNLLKVTVEADLKDILPEDAKDDAVTKDSLNDKPMEHQDDHILLQATVELDSKEDILPDGLPLCADEIETDGGHFNPEVDEVCQESERLVPPEGSEDQVANMFQSQDRNEEIFDHELVNEEPHIDSFHNDIWDELENVICEVIEVMEAYPKDAETPTDCFQENETQISENKEILDTVASEVDNETMVFQKDDSETKDQVEDGQFEVRCNQEENLEAVTINANANGIHDEHCQITQTKAKADVDIQSVGSKVVTSKVPRVYQVKAVPVVPPKPQHCKLTALTLQQKLRDRSGEDGVGQGGTEAEVKVNVEGSRPGLQSMCFDEAVAMATLRRGRARESDRDRLRDMDM